MLLILIDPYRQAVESVEVNGREPDPAHPAAAQVKTLIECDNPDRQMLPDGDLILYHLDDLFTPGPTGAMYQGRLTFGYALIYPGSTRRPLTTSAEDVRESIQWITTFSEAREAVQSIHF